MTLPASVFRPYHSWNVPKVGTTSEKNENGFYGDSPTENSLLQLQLCNPYVSKNFVCLTVEASSHLTGYPVANARSGTRMARSTQRSSVFSEKSYRSFLQASERHGVHLHLSSVPGRINPEAMHEDLSAKMQYSRLERTSL